MPLCLAFAVYLNLYLHTYIYLYLYLYLCLYIYIYILYPLDAQHVRFGSTFCVGDGCVV